MKNEKKPLTEKRFKPILGYIKSNAEDMLVDETVSAAAVEKLIVQNGGKFLREVRLFDVYTGEQIEAGKKSLAFSLQFQSADKTLTDEDVEVPFGTILKKVEETFAAKLRS